MSELWESRTDALQTLVSRLLLAQNGPDTAAALWHLERYFLAQAVAPPLPVHSVLLRQAVQRAVEPLSDSDAVAGIMPLLPAEERKLWHSGRIEILKARVTRELADSTLRALRREAAAASLG